MSIPLNYNKRLDLSSRVIDAPDGRIAPAEGVLGQTLAVLYGGTPLDTAFDQSDTIEVWDQAEHDHIHHSAKLEEFLSRNYNVSNLFAHDAVRSNFNKGLEHALFQVCLFVCCATLTPQNGQGTQHPKFLTSGSSALQSTCVAYR